MATTVTIDGSSVTVPTTILPVRVVTCVWKGVPSFTFQVRGGPLPTGADPYLGLPVVVAIDGTDVFAGDVASVHPTYEHGTGWVRTYQCLGMRARGDRIGHTDDNNSADTSTYNAASDNETLDYRADRAGKTIGEILTDILTMDTNANALDALGLCAYTSLSPPTLPTATTTDLATLATVPQTSVRFGGERLFNAIEGLITAWQPNHWFDVEPDGTLRFHDTRTFTEHVFTHGTDPIELDGVTRDVGQCYQRIVVRGESLAEMFLFSTARSTLSEDPFAHDSLTVSQAKAAWTPSDFYSPEADSEGTCTCSSTTSVTVDPTDASQTWTTDYWDQTTSGKHGVIFLTYTSGSTITMMAQRRITANASLSAGGTAAVTVDRALPHTNYNRYVIRGTHRDPSAVWCEYELPSWAADKIAKQSSYDFPFIHSNGIAETLVSTPMGEVCWSSSGSPPYSSVVIGITVDQGAGTIRFPQPTYAMAGMRTPSDVRALVPIYTDTNTVTLPPDSGGPQYEGTSHTVDGLERTLHVYLPSWRDPANATFVEDFAQDLLDSVKDTVLEGQVRYLGLYADAFAPGISASITGDTYSTGWDSAEIPVVECQVEWTSAPGSGVNHVTTMRVSNRRAHLSEAAFLHPDRTGETFWPDASLDLSAFAGLSFDVGGVMGGVNRMIAEGFASATSQGPGLYVPDMPVGNVLRPEPKKRFAPPQGNIDLP